MEIVLFALIVGIIGYAWYIIDKGINDKAAEKAKAAEAVVVSTKVDVITAETVSAEPKEVPKELLEAQVNVEKVKKAARKTAAKPVEAEAPAKVAKVKRQYTKKAKE